jgi:ERF superfamily
MKADLLEVTAEPKQELQRTDTGIMEMFERLACDPNASVDKIERLMALMERGQAKKSEEHFNASMSRAQKAMRPVAADATNPQTRSRYASYAALDCALRPVYTDNGFGLSFNTGEAPQAEYVRVLCDVSHIGGHSKTYHLDMPADGKGAKGGDVMTKTHAVGSALSYGMRYLLKMIFNVAVGEDDDDGNMAGAKGSNTEGPAGYDNWLSDLHAVAETGFAAFESAWAKAPQQFTKHLAATAPLLLAKLKTKARSVGK